MSELKCPFCNKKLEPIGTSGQFQCGTWGCNASFNFIATRDVWEYIDRTRKKFDIAMDGIKRIEKLTEPSYKNRNLEALALAVNTFSGEIIEQINQRKNNE